MELRKIQKQAWETAEEKGFHEARDSSTPVALALIHSEVSEALESDRKDTPDEAEKLRTWALEADHQFLRKVLIKAAEQIENDPIGEEMADIVIRVADLAEEEGIDLQSEVEKKMEVNKNREEKHGNNSY